jgi:hypothetical protein
MLFEYTKEQVIESCKNHGFSDDLAEAFWKNKSESKIEDFYDYDPGDLYYFVTENFHIEKTTEGEIFWDEVANGNRLSFENTEYCKKHDYVKVPEGMTKEKAESILNNYKKPNQKLLEAMKKYNVPKTKEEAIASLIKLGLLEEDGSLSPNYYTEEQIAESKKKKSH